MTIPPGLTDSDGNPRRFPFSTLEAPGDVSLSGVGAAARLTWSVEQDPGIEEFVRTRQLDAFGARPDLVFKEPGQDLLTDFLQLATGSEDSVLRYARKWGVLWLCEHDVPWTHNLFIDAAPGGATHAGCEPRQSEDGLNYWEPVSAWRRYAREARVLLDIAERLREGNMATAEQWKVIFGNRPDTALIHILGTVSGQKWVLDAELSRWLQLGEVRVALAWGQTGLIGKGGDSSLVIGSQSLFGQLALRLALAVSGSPGFLLCDGCKRPFSPPTRRGRRAGVLHYCDGCGEKTREAAAQDRQRARKKQVHQLAKRGMAPAAIAKQIGSRIGTVRGWLAKTAPSTKKRGSVK